MNEHRPISLNVHVALDYLLTLIGFVGPWALGFTDQPLPFDYTLGAAAFGMALNLTTDYPGGLIRLTPLKRRRFLEFIGPGVFVAGPMLLFPRSVAALFLAAIGVGVFLNAALTQPVRVAAPV